MNSFFNKIYVVSLEGSDRRKSIDELMNKHNMSFEYIDAVNGYNMFKSQDEHIDWYVKNFHDQRLVNGWIPSHGQIGCWLSHVKIWKKMVDEDIESALILEDDVTFRDDINEEFSRRVKNVPSDWNALAVGYNCGGVAKTINEDICQLVNFSGTYGYALKKSCAQILLDLYFPMQAAVDGFLGCILWANVEGNIYKQLFVDNLNGSREARNPKFDLKKLKLINS